MKKEIIEVDVDIHMAPKKEYPIKVKISNIERRDQGLITVNLK